MHQNCQKHCYRGIQSKLSLQQFQGVAYSMDWLVSCITINLFKIISKFYYFLANLWSILRLSSNVPIQTNQSPLSSLSISVLLILVNHCTSPPPPKGNPYRASIASLSGNNIPKLFLKKWNFQ